MAIYGPTPGFKRRIFKLCVLNRRDSNRKYFQNKKMDTKGLEEEKEAKELEQEDEARGEGGDRGGYG